MYQKIIRPILFLFDAEKVHHFAGMLLIILARCSLTGRLLRKFFTVKHPSLERNLFGLHFPNPVGVAAGFDKEGKLYNGLASFGFSHVEIGTVTPKGQPGNPKPRIFRLPLDGALINRMGFNNHGVEAQAENLRRNKPQLIIGGNIGKNTLTPNNLAIDDYCHSFEVLFELVDYFVVNVSCPNIANLTKLQDKDELLELLRAIQKLNQSKKAPKPVLLKIAPDLNYHQLDEIIEIVLQTGLSGIIATNTTTTRLNLKSPADKVAQIGNGGLSGTPLTQRSTEVIRYLHTRSDGKIPIIGVGGIMTPQDALEKLAAGASLIQVYTGFVYYGPFLAKNINKLIVKGTKQ
ncbi:MAG TPA: dihydroorotate dehydrogenase (quinone) [Bacteroidales bacterium]|nr:dihydroorotate dehydrogenase (quinone) [Bacteroidales bacterium]